MGLLCFACFSSLAYCFDSLRWIQTVTGLERSTAAVRFVWLLSFCIALTLYYCPPLVAEGSMRVIVNEAVNKGGRRDKRRDRTHRGAMGQDWTSGRRVDAGRDKRQSREGRGAAGQDEVRRWDKAG